MRSERKFCLHSKCRKLMLEIFSPLDEWNTHEQLCLASAVVSSGDQNWMSVSRALKACVTNFSSRPIDWFLAKPCATQYGKLLDCVDTPKRKKVSQWSHLLHDSTKLLLFFSSAPHLKETSRLKLHRLLLNLWWKSLLPNVSLNYKAP